MDPTRNELGDFLRARRERLDVSVIRPGGTKRRRTPGLRREEVAELAGIGVDWYIRLEQGRVVSPSESTIKSLGEALRLSATEIAHLRSLAAQPGRRRLTREVVPTPLLHLLAGINRPAYVTGRRWDVLAWNARALQMFPGFDRLPECDRNVLIWTLTRPEAKRTFGSGWAEEAKRMIGVFRATHDLWAGDPAFVALRRRLLSDSPEFKAWWNAHHIHEPGAGSKTFYHDAKSSSRFEYMSFQSNDDPSLRVSIYSPVKSP